MHPTTRWWPSTGVTSRLGSQQNALTGDRLDRPSMLSTTCALTPRRPWRGLGRQSELRPRSSDASGDDDGSPRRRWRSRGRPLADSTFTTRRLGIGSGRGYRLVHRAHTVASGCCGEGVRTSDCVPRFTAPDNQGIPRNHRRHLRVPRGPWRSTHRVCTGNFERLHQRASTAISSSLRPTQTASSIRLRTTRDRRVPRKLCPGRSPARESDWDLTLGSA